MDQQKGGSFEPNEPPLDPPLTSIAHTDVTCNKRDLVWEVACVE
jgi:hypothetical protein